MTILSIVSSVLSLVAMVVGDRILAKWVAAVRLWWREGAEKALKEQADREFLRLQLDWKKLQDDRKPFRPQNP